jgi:hypothetical protein
MHDRCRTSCILDGCRHHQHECTPLLGTIMYNSKRQRRCPVCLPIQCQVPQALSTCSQMHALTCSCTALQHAPYLVLLKRYCCTCHMQQLPGKFSNSIRLLLRMQSTDQGQSQQMRNALIRQHTSNAKDQYSTNAVSGSRLWYSCIQQEAIMYTHSSDRSLELLVPQLL